MIFSSHSFVESIISYIDSRKSSSSHLEPIIPMMDTSFPVPWFEDLDMHRGPALYYIRSDEAAQAGPFFITNWDGPPTDHGEFDLDIMSRLVEAEQIPPRNKEQKTNTTAASTTLKSNHGPLGVEDDDDEDEDNVGLSRLLIQIKLTEDSRTDIVYDCQTNYLSEPPMVSNLLQRLASIETENEMLRKQMGLPSRLNMPPTDFNTTTTNNRIAAVTSSSSSSTTTTTTSMPSSRSSDEGVNCDKSPSSVGSSYTQGSQNCDWKRSCSPSDENDISKRRKLGKPPLKVSKVKEMRRSGASKQSANKYH